MQLAGTVSKNHRTSQPGVTELHLLGDRDELSTILLVDDNPADVDLLRMALAANGVVGRLLIASNGREAMAIANDLNSGVLACPDLIVLDINMPFFSGLEVLERLRASTICPQPPVAILSTAASPEDVRTASALGATCYLEKPMTLEGYFSVGTELKRLIPIGSWLG
ncbi:MAG: histidine kinase [Bryobacterales bacterium]|nr:histidine kinase [Bryobacterales bacterium]